MESIIIVWCKHPSR